ncbi:hypothetical protein F4692_001684 [Nocardioides cavernae]|uniref:N-acetyltransferase n=1 Tax=Nocardioides cavernae TaxID=1921566 RepID=A0A7Y9KPC1_9ACTN|nr:GNAT family N-acetyltransferase [Nocardioides cavernae]NYE36551.1 hypothetical protein [Nocardioides cavernae]
MTGNGRRAGRTPQLLQFLMAHVLADPAVQRIVLEPDVDNAKSVALMERMSAELGPVTEVPAPMPDLPAKRAQFAFVSRPAGAQASARVASSTNAGSSSWSP